jgi:hypothetical protein
MFDREIPVDAPRSRIIKALKFSVSGWFGKVHIAMIRENPDGVKRL